MLHRVSRFFFYFPTRFTDVENYWAKNHLFPFCLSLFSRFFPLLLNIGRATKTGQAITRVKQASCQSPHNQNVVVLFVSATSVGVNKRHGSDMLRQVAVSKVSSRHRPSTATRQNRFDFQPLCCCDHFLLKHLSLHSFKVLDSVSQSVVAFAARAFFPFICVSVLAEKPVGRMTHGDGMGEWPGADCRNWNASLQAVNQQHEDDTFKMWQTKKKKIQVGCSFTRMEIKKMQKKRHRRFVGSMQIPAEAFH